MGGTCSSRRKNSSSQNMLLDTTYNLNRADVVCRHTVETQLPDESIAGLYPVEDNYVLDNNGMTRSPKTLVELCIDSICRNLVDFDDTIPPNLPKELIDQIVHSLVKHSALTATTLRSLRKCELGDLKLSRSRGVSDEWFSVFMSGKAVEQDDEYASQSSSDASFHSANSAKKEYTSDSKDIQMEPLIKWHESHMIDSSMSFSSYGDAFPKSIEIVSSTSQIKILDLRGSQKLTDRGLLQLNDLYSLEVARLDQCYSLVGKGFLVFSKSNNLHTLTASNCRCLTDEAIVNISHLQSLTTLSLDGCRCLTDISLRAIGNLINLQQLDLSQLDLLTSEGLKYLVGLEQLEEISLGWCRAIDDDGIKILTSQPGRSSTLRNLCLARCRITDVGVEYLGSLKNLRELDLNGCQSISSASLGDTIARLPSLECLDVSYCSDILCRSWQGKIGSLRALHLSYSDVKDEHLSRLTNLPCLEELTLDSSEITDWSLAHFADNNVSPNLTVLDLADCDVSDMGLSHLPKFKQLKNLSLFYCDISNDGLEYISEMKNLEVLNLDSREISDDGLFYLRKLKNLKCLDIFSGRITDVGCAHISKIKSLVTLELCGGGIGDLGCSHLSSLVNLTSLNLSQNESITNAGASFLVTLTKLKSLNLSSTKVDGGALAIFKDLKQLQSLALYGCRDVESVHISSLQHQLPNLKCLRIDGNITRDGTMRRQSDNHQLDEDMSDEDDEESDTDAEDMFVD